jgi:deoxyribodipyrimidine photo-lyase
VKRGVVLFTRDLRVHDHAALSAAVAIAWEIVPLFVLDDALYDQHRCPARRAFLLDSLADLRHALRERGGDLVMRRGDSVKETLRLAHRAAASIVFVGAEGSTHCAASRAATRTCLPTRADRAPSREHDRGGAAGRARSGRPRPLPRLHALLAALA